MSPDFGVIDDSRFCHIMWFKILEYSKTLYLSVNCIEYVGTKYKKQSQKQTIRMEQINELTKYKQARKTKTKQKTVKKELTLAYIRKTLPNCIYIHKQKHSITNKKDKQPKKCTNK